MSELRSAEVATIESAQDSPKTAKWGKRLGFAAFMFFLIKGLAWLIVPTVVAVVATR